MSDLTPYEILDDAFEEAATNPAPSIADVRIRTRLEFVCKYMKNRSGVRLILSCTLVKISKPTVDIRKPFTEIGGHDSYSGRTYDEKYVTDFINRYGLPCNPTTAFLTPALRTNPTTLDLGTDLGGRPKKLYKDAIALLNDVYENRITAEQLLTDMIRCLLKVKHMREERMQSLLEELRHAADSVTLSSEDIVSLIQQHLSIPGASRLPVLVVAAAYEAASHILKERILPLQAHTAADERTGALGDVEITLIDDDKVITGYEMKLKSVSRKDIDRALQKIHSSKHRVDNYIFITTEAIDEEVLEYAKELYPKTGGIEFTILDCLDFLRYFLHLFHRIRFEFLELYQELLLAESESAVRQEVKEAFLVLRRAVQYDDDA